MVMRAARIIAVPFVLLLCYGQDQASGGEYNELAKVLKDGSDKDRISAIWELAQAHSSSREAIGLIAGALAARSDEVRFAARLALIELGPSADFAVTAVVLLIEKAEQTRETELILLLGSMAPACSSARDALMKLLYHSGAHKRITAVSAIGGGWELCQEGFQRLAWMVSKDDMVVAWRAARILWQKGGTDEGAVPLLCEGMSSPDVRRQALCAWALGDIGPAAVEATENLNALKASPSLSCQAAASYALWSIGVPEPDIINALTKCILGRESLLRCLDTLGRQGQAAQSAIPVVEPLLSRDSPYYVRSSAVLCIGQIAGGRSQRAATLLVSCAEDPHSSVRVAVCRSMTMLSGRPEVSVAVLRQLLRDSDFLVVNEAITSLGRLGASAEPAIGDLAAKMGDPSHSVTAANSLSRVGTVNAAMALVSALREHYSAAPEIVKALSTMGPAAKEVLKVLVVIRDDESERSSVRDAAAEAIVGIGK